MLKFIKHIGNAIFIGTLIFLISIAFNFFSSNFQEVLSLNEAWEWYYSNLIFAVILYFVNTYWIHLFIRWFKPKVQFGKNELIGFLGNILFSLVGIFIARLIIVVGINKVFIVDFLRHEALEYYKFSLLVSVLISIIFYLGWYFKYWQENKVKEQKIIAGTAAAKFDALKNQLDPHFLFNSLNVLTSLIEEDPVQAQKFTTSLSKVYRYVLEQKNKDLVTVDEELSFAKTYVRLLKMRFEDSIIFSIPDKSSVSEAKIVPLSLQLLLENAVKHNVVTSEKPLHIKLYEEGGMLCVSNNIQEKQLVHKSSGVGLMNIRERYKILSKRAVQIEKTSTEFRVKLPVLTIPIKEYMEDENF